MSDGPEQWSNPSDVMKRRKLKRKSKSICGAFPSSKISYNTINSKPSITASVKRSNPFSCDLQNKRRAISDLSALSSVLEQNLSPSETSDIVDYQKEQEGSDSILNLKKTVNNTYNGLAKSFDLESSSRLSVLEDDVGINKTSQSLKPEISSSKYRQLHGMVTDLKENVSINDRIKEKNINKDTTDTEIYDKIPIDWSLKSKLRIASVDNLTWCINMKSVDEATGLQNFLTCHDSWDSPESSFKRCSLYWQHPNLPWTKLFPRIVSENKISRTNVIVNNEEIKESLFSDWSESFTSVFHQLRSNYCPYFYVCTHQFTVLFRGQGVAGHSKITALLSPTTRGFREALKLEGIEYSMPILEKKKMTVEGEVEENEVDKVCGTTEEDGGEDCLDTDEGASVWLESMGLDKKQFPSLDPNKVKIQKEGYRRVDNRPESMLLIQGSEVQGLFNFLLNCRSCIASSGEQAGLPPTILSPSPFIGSIFKSNKVKHSSAKQTDSEGNSYRSNILEITGPILPHNVLNLSSLLEEQLASDFSLTFNNHEPTAPFNTYLEPHAESSDCDRNNVNLRSDVKSRLYNSQQLEKNVCCIKMINKTDSGFTVTI